MTAPFIAFNPCNGIALPLPLALTIEEAHRTWPAEPRGVWYHNPWTGNYRDSRDVFNDPWGHGEGLAEAPVRAATPIFQVSGYETLSAVLIRAYEQAACGKGAERHATALPFHRQPMQSIEALVGGGFCAGQAIKKIQEAGRMGRDAAVRELLGAIVYIAGNIIALESAGQLAKDGDQ